jgi:ABC-type glycerol-3-phosphate transport system permease component
MFGPLLRPEAPTDGVRAPAVRRAFPTPPPPPPEPRWLDPALEAGKHAYIVSVLAFAFLPLYLMLIVSVKTNAQFFAAPGTITAPVHWVNFATAWRMVAPTLANSLFMTILSTAVTLWVGLWAAYFFARVRVPGTMLLWNAVLLLMSLPTIANLVPLFRLLADLQMLNTLTALIVVTASAGQVFAIFVLRNFIADIPQEVFDAAEVDGASHFEQVRTIVIPQAGAILGTVGVTHFVGQWNEFLLPLIVMRDHARLPVTVELLRMSGEYIKLWGPLMAGYALASIPVIILFLFTMRFFMRGQAEGIH